MLYQLECFMNDKDYYEFNKYHMKNDAGLKKYNLFVKLLVPVMLLFVLIYYKAIGFDWSGIRFAAIIFGIASVIWVLFLAEPLELLSLKLRIKRMKKYGKLPYSSFAAMEFYDDHLVETTKDIKAEIKYDALNKVCINDKKAIYIYQNAPKALVIPFNTFESDEKAEEFYAFINGKINKESSERAV